MKPLDANDAIMPGDEVDKLEQGDTLTPEEREALNPQPPEAPQGRIPGLPDSQDLREWGGVRHVKKQLRRSFTIMENREAIAHAMLCIGATSITDVCSWGEAGMRVKPSSELDPRHAKAIRKVTMRKVVTGSGKDKVTTITQEVELFDKPQMLRLLAQAAGMLARDTEDDKPAIIGMRVVGPRRKPKTIEQPKRRKVA